MLKVQIHLLLVDVVNYLRRVSMDILLYLPSLQAMAKTKAKSDRPRSSLSVTASVAKGH